MIQADDKSIIDLCLNHDTRERGFTLLVDKYKEQIYWHIRRLVISHHNSDDVFQETMINIFNHLNKFRGDSSLYTWIYRIATNEALKFLKKQKMKQKDTDDPIFKQLSTSGEIDSEQLLQLFEKSIQSLPFKQQVVFNLRYYSNLSYEEMAEITGSSVESLKTNYHYASKKIKEIMLNHTI